MRTFRVLEGILGAVVVEADHIMYDLAQDEKEVNIDGKSFLLKTGAKANYLKNDPIYKGHCWYIESGASPVRYRFEHDVYPDLLFYYELGQNVKPFALPREEIVLLKEMTKDELAKVLYPEHTCDMALPQPWADRIRAEFRYNPVPWYVWGYEKGHGVFGEPLPLTQEAKKALHRAL